LLKWGFGTGRGRARDPYGTFEIKKIRSNKIFCCDAERTRSYTTHDAELGLHYFYN